MPLWLPSLLCLWGLIYVLQALGYGIIMNWRSKNVTFSQLLRVTISGFALNHVTPCGLLGGEFYRVMEEQPYKTVALFGHGTASATVFSHLFNIPLPQIIGLLYIDYTCVIVVELPDRPGELVFPKLVSTDAHHIAGLEIENVYGN
jgi:hypothetical protein